MAKQLKVVMTNTITTKTQSLNLFKQYVYIKTKQGFQCELSNKKACFNQIFANIFKSYEMIPKKQ